MHNIITDDFVGVSDSEEQLQKPIYNIYTLLQLFPRDRAMDLQVDQKIARQKLILAVKTDALSAGTFQLDFHEVQPF